jgi:hypothetical protein
MQLRIPNLSPEVDTGVCRGGRAHRPGHTSSSRPAVRLRVNLFDKDLSAHDPIGSFELGGGDFRAALRVGHLRRPPGTWERESAGFFQRIGGNRDEDLLAPGTQLAPWAKRRAGHRTSSRARASAISPRCAIEPGSQRRRGPSEMRPVLSPPERPTQVWRRVGSVLAGTRSREGLEQLRKELDPDCSARAAAKGTRAALPLPGTQKILTMAICFFRRYVRSAGGAAAASASTAQLTQRADWESAEGFGRK